MVNSWSSANIFCSFDLIVDCIDCIDCIDFDCYYIDRYTVAVVVVVVDNICWADCC